MCVASRTLHVLGNKPCTPASPAVLEVHPSSLVPHQTAVQAREVQAAWEGQVALCTPQTDARKVPAQYTGISSNSIRCKSQGLHAQFLLCAPFSEWSYQEPFRFSLHRWKTGICLHPLRSLASPAVPTALLRCSGSRTCYNGGVLYRSNSAAIGAFARDGHIFPLRNNRLIKRIILVSNYS